METGRSIPSRLNTCLMTFGMLLALAPHHALGQEGSISTWAATHTKVSMSAHEAGLGDVIEAGIEHPGDVDVFVVSVAEGTTLDLEVLARCHGSRLDPTLSLSNESGDRVAHHIDSDGLGSRIRFAVPSSGRYFISVRGFGGSGGPNHTYRLTIGGTKPALPTLIASLVAGPSTVAGISISW